MNTLVAAVLAACLAAGGVQAFAQEAAPDPYLWLEDAHGARAMEWVGQENAKTAAVLEKDPRFDHLRDEAFRIDSAEDRIPAPSFLAGDVFNFWQDAAHVRGLWRRTSLAGYAAAAPSWTTVLDLDAVSAAEHANWFFKGAECEGLRQRRCLLSLSDGGEDAVAVREFDLPSAAFVPGGFALPKGKQRAAFEDENQILVSREWAPGELTASGYPFVVKRLSRGEPLSAAREIFRGSASDGGYGVSPVTLVDGDGARVTFIERPLSTFESELYLVAGDRTERVALPPKFELRALLSGRLVLSLAEDWNAGGARFPSGALVSVDLTALRADPAHLKPTLILAPGPRQSLGEVAATRGRLIVTSYDNVRGRVAIYRPGGSGWSAQPLHTGENLTLHVYDADIHSEHAFLGSEGFLTPNTVSLLDAATGVQQVVKTLPPKFDAARDVVEQREATSSDGVKIPYFVVHPRGMRLDGSNPTILTAYGGFQVSETPRYLGSIGKLWLEQNGVWVLANIRGGGEFGPAWHEAGLKTRRQIIYDDFASVAQDLFRSGVTSPRRLGIRGGSNGGLLMGVEFTQHPQFWRAVDIAVPLLDMLRFEKIAAGTSWVGEYGSVSVPDQRAFLAKISPYNNLHEGVAYPTPFIWTTTKDDRVGPQHARKFAAKLAALGDPYLFYEVTEGGHGAGANIAERAKTEALEMTYFSQRLID